MPNFIDRLQKKPYETRVRILWWTTGVLAIALVVIWIVSLKSTIKNTSGGSIIPDASQSAVGSQETSQFLTVERIEKTDQVLKIYFNLNNQTTDILNVPVKDDITLTISAGGLHPLSILDRQGQPFNQKILSHTQAFGTLVFSTVTTDETGQLTFDQLVLENEPNQPLKQEINLDFIKLNQTTNVRN